MQPKAVMLGNEKVYDYGDWLSRLHLPNYCPKCKSRDVYVSHDEDGRDLMRCPNCHFTIIANTIKEGYTMEFRIHNGEYEDSLVISGDTIEELQEKAQRETDKRGWKDCWSEELKN